MEDCEPEVFNETDVEQTCSTCDCKILLNVQYTAEETLRNKHM